MPGSGGRPALALYLDQGGPAPSSVLQVLAGSFLAVSSIFSITRFSTSLTWSGASPVSLLSLAGVDSSDSGLITCTANNTFGTATKTFLLSVLQPPAPPSSLTVSSVGSRSVLLSWSPPPPSPLPLLAYVVRYGAEGRAGGQEVTTQGDTTEMELRSLSPGAR